MLTGIVGKGIPDHVEKVCRGGADTLAADSHSQQFLTTLAALKAQGAASWPIAMGGEFSLRAPLLKSRFTLTKG